MFKKEEIQSFKNRAHAGSLLADEVVQQLPSLAPLPVHEQIVVGLPRGGVSVAREVAARLEAPLTVLVSKKIGAPGYPELAVGAVSSVGVVVLNKELSSHLDGQQTYLEDEIIRLTQETKELERKWLNGAGIAEPLSLAGKRVIIVDDGIATGMTAEAALKSVIQSGAVQVVLATPVIAHDTKRKLQQECDLLITVITPQQFWAVGQFYEDFHQVEDKEVIEALQDVDFALSKAS